MSQIGVPQRLAAQLLPAPTLYSPSNGATGVSTTPFFDWSSVSGANRYWLTVATSSGTLPTNPSAVSCPGCVISCTTTSSSHTGGSSCTSGQSQMLSGGTTYYWKVQAWNTNGTNGYYSSTRSFTTETALLPAPTLYSPSNGATGVSTTPFFDWSSVSGANRYWLTVASSSGTLPTNPSAVSCPGCVISCTTTSSSHTGGSSCTSGQSQVLSGGTTYYWKVQAWNTNGTNGNYSSTRSFATETALLPAPTLYSPSTGATGVSTTPFFDWSSVSGANRYWLTVATSNGTLPTNPSAVSCPGCVISCTTTSSSHTAGSSCTIGQSQSLSTGTTYYWKVQAWNTNGTDGDYSGTRSFTTEVPPLLPAPTLYLPSNGATGLSTTPYFDWLSVSSANRYWLTVATSSGTLPTDPNAVSCPGCIISCTTTSSNHTGGSSCTFGQSQALNAGTTYYWRAQAWNTNGTQGNYPTIWSFTTQGAVTPDIRITPLSLSFESGGELSGFSRDGAPEDRSLPPIDWDLGTGLDGALMEGADLPAVVNTEVDVDLGREANLRSSADVVADTQGLRLAVGVENGVVESVPMLAPMAFSSLGVKWTASLGDGLELAVRSSANGVDWSSWIDVTVDEHLTDRSTSTFFGNLIGVAEDTGLIQYAVRLTRTAGGPSPVLTSLTFFFIDPGETPVGILERLLASEPAALSRTQWGCPDGESSPGWPPAYTTVSHLIVHHTVTTNSAIDWPAQVRSIWSYHANSQGWGDIGYNFLIDPLGVIYEGRSGGENAIGAHFSCKNGGTQGIALLGTYSSTTPTAAALASLEALLAWIASREGLEPQQTSFHAGTQLSLDTISGHRDGNPSEHVCSNTACPGDSFYPLLPGIRSNVAALLSGAAGQAFTIYNDGGTTLSIHSMQLQSAGSWIDWTPQAPFDVAPGGSRQITVSVDFDAAPAGTSTRWLLVSSNDPDESPYPGGVDIIVDNLSLCYGLSRSHTGSGDHPSTSPANSPGCPSGQYTAGSSIQVTAGPAAGWTVGSWNGTVNDGSTSMANTVSMPASSHAVTVNYVQVPPPCFNLTRVHTGSGADPVASPPNSTGCSSGRYVAGETIQMSADPAAGWTVEGWSGTLNDASTAEFNTVSMPAGDHTVGVAYEEQQPGCHDLTLSHSGSGGDPTAWPASSGGCPTGQYAAGSLIQLTAAPASGWIVSSWNGTDNNGSTSTTNTVTMSAGNHTASVSYAPTGSVPLIFQDGFESGDTSAWSVTVP